jgi:hypothetical protein
MVFVAPPNSPTVWMPLFWPLSVIVSVPDSGGVTPAFAVHVTEIVQEFVGWTVESPQLSFSLKSAGATFTVAIDSPLVPVFVTVIVCGGLVVPVACGPNVSENGETLANGPDMPVPAKLTG